MEHKERCARYRPKILKAADRMVRPAAAAAAAKCAITLFTKTAFRILFHGLLQRELNRLGPISPLLYGKYTDGSEITKHRQRERDDALIESTPCSSLANSLSSLFLSSSLSLSLTFSFAPLEIEKYGK